MIRRLTAVLLLAATVPACADEPVAGVVLDRTVTVAGHAFYQTFCMFWLDKPLNERFSLAIHERLSARRGNQVAVEYAGRVLFQAVLPPARADLRPLGQQAADVAYDTAANADVRRLLFSGNELAPDELQEGP